MLPYRYVLPGGASDKCSEKAIGEEFDGSALLKLRQINSRVFAGDPASRICPVSLFQVRSELLYWSNLEDFRQSIFPGLRPEWDASSFSDSFLPRMTVFKTHPSGSAPSRGFLTRIPLAAFAQNDGAVFSPRAFGTSLQDRRQIDQILSPPFSLLSAEFWESLDNSQLRRSLGM